MVLIRLPLGTLVQLIVDSPCTAKRCVKWGRISCWDCRTFDPRILRGKKMLTENKRNKAKHKLRLLQKVCLNYVTNSFEHNPDAKHYLFHLPRQKSDPSNKRKVVKTLSIVRSFSTNIFRQPPSPTNRRHRR